MSLRKSQRDMTCPAVGLVDRASLSTGGGFGPRPFPASMQGCLYHAGTFSWTRVRHGESSCCSTEGRPPGRNGGTWKHPPPASNLADRELTRETVWSVRGACSPLRGRSCRALRRGILGSRSRWKPCTYPASLPAPLWMLSKARDTHPVRVAQRWRGDAPHQRPAPYLFAAVCQASGARRPRCAPHPQPPRRGRLPQGDMT